MADEKYEFAEDGLTREIVGEWALEKHERLKRYIDIYRYTRKKFLSGPSGSATYIDLFCGPGQSRIRDTNTIIDGSPLVAFKAARAGGQPFSGIHLGDFSAEIVDAACSRISNAGGVATRYVGAAEAVADQVVAAVDEYGLHFALLDPYKLETLSFAIIRSLSRLRRIDMLLHVSAMDLQRNLDAYGEADVAALDAFAPGWRTAVDHKAKSRHSARAAILNYWCGLVEQLGFSRPRYDLVTGSKNQRLYWLAFISREPIANDFWEKIRYISGQGDLPGL
ncbi:MAG: three-Cys-motif partner protein TcmP [Alphaproteobacteria bacterium]|nr:three-Cys-motif partner protein TcmP [Alphaproteobacteria bacterium]MDE2495630.1 three-Cys-motif partner protein TcmP [Alphaproteobacteria bacterium]